MYYHRPSNRVIVATHFTDQNTKEARTNLVCIAGAKLHSVYRDGRYTNARIPQARTKVTSQPTGSSH